MREKNVYYKVMFDDGDVHIELYPEEDDFEDYDNSNLEHVKEFASKYSDVKIIKVTKQFISNIVTKLTAEEL